MENQKILIVSFENYHTPEVFAINEEGSELPVVRECLISQLHMDSKYSPHLVETLVKLQEGKPVFETLRPLGRIAVEQFENFAMRKWRRNQDVWYTILEDGTKL